MDLNFLSRLGLISPGPGVDPTGGYAPPEAVPQPNAAPVNLLEGIPGYGAAPAAAPAVAPPQAAPAANLLQSLNAGAPADAMPAADPVTRPARARSSAVDIIGRLADVFAKVGGADALYQPTLDARQDREIALGDHDRSVSMQKIKLADATGDLGDKGNARLGNAIRGLQAITSANPQADISKVWPLLAAQAGVDPARAQALGEQFATNPDLLKGLTTSLGAQKEFGLNPFFYTDKDGKLQAGQMAKDGTFQRIDLDGGSATDPTKAVNLGDRTALVGTRTGTVTDTLANGEKPGGAADRASRERIAGNRDRTAITIAGMPARAQPGKGGAATGATSEARAAVGQTLDELEGIYGKLDKMGAIVSPRRGAAGNVMSYLRSSGAGQVVEGALGTEAQTLRDRVASIRPGLMQSLAKATGMTGKQLDSNADVKLFMQTVTNPQASYEANQKAIAGLRRMLANAPAAGGNSGGGGTRTLPPRLGAPRAAPRKPAGKPTVSNW